MTHEATEAIQYLWHEDVHLRFQSKAAGAAVCSIKLWVVLFWPRISTQCMGQKHLDVQPSLLISHTGLSEFLYFTEQVNCGETLHDGSAIAQDSCIE